MSTENFRSQREQEFTEKYKKYGEILYRIAYMYLGNSADAEDVLQDVFTKYFFTQKTFFTTEHEKAWFIRATQNKSVDLLRKKSHSEKNIDFSALVFEESEDTQNREMHQDILKKIYELKPKYIAVVILYYYNDYSVEEISNTLKISKNSVKKRLQRAREALKTELEDYLK